MNIAVWIKICYKNVEIEIKIKITKFKHVFNAYFKSNRFFRILLQHTKNIWSKHQGFDFHNYVVLTYLTDNNFNVDFTEHLVLLVF